MRLNYIDELQCDFPHEFSVARRASERIIECINGQDYSALEAHSPGLKGFDWKNYISLSAIRMVRVLRLLNLYAKPGARVLDFGAYFGNFSLMLADAGFEVTALDSFDTYGQCVTDNVRLMTECGVQVRNFSAFEPEGNYDVVVLMGVIEHVPHTPRFLLENVRKAMVQEGLLILDTPNLAYIYNRQKLSMGESIFAPIRSQFWTETPFEGHHREYTADEIEWMLETAGFLVFESEAFNYSLYGLSELSGMDLDNFEKMKRDPSLRELLIYAAGSKWLSECI